MTPQAKRIQALFNARGEHVVNDHVAFRTFDIEGFDLDRATELLAAIGYESFDHYTFPDKHLRATAYCVSGDPSAPKIFFSELIRSELDADAQAIICEVTGSLEGELTLSDLTGYYPFHINQHLNNTKSSPTRANMQAGCQRWVIKPITSQSM